MAEQDVKGRRSVRFVCGTPPKEGCTGLAGYNNLFRVHSSQEQVMQCKVAYLLRQGYKKLSPREFEDPVTGRILVLFKKAERSKPGKADRPMTAKSRTRYM